MVVREIFKVKGVDLSRYTKFRKGKPAVREISR